MRAKRWIVVWAGGLAACGGPAADGYYAGYAEGEYVRVASPIGGQLLKLHVQRGDQAAAAAPAFVLEQESERAARSEAETRVARAQALLANLQRGRRPDEIAALAAQRAQAAAAVELSAAELARQQQLQAAHYISPARLDAARAEAARDRARLAEAEAQLRLARLGARSDEIRAATQEVAAARAQLSQIEWRLAQKTVRVPAAGQVTEVWYREGELVGAGSPVLALLPPQNIKARFFVPETALGALRLGQPVSLSCDGCGRAIAAQISYISNTAEYTAPQIYSRENRATLVFMIEARPAAADAQRLHPGQPLEIRLGKS